MSKLNLYPHLNEIKDYYEELKEKGKISAVDELNLKMYPCEEKFKLCSTLPPMPFFGNLNSPYAFINFNPGGADASYNNKLREFVMNKTFDEYYNFLFHYEMHYNNVKTVGKFDSKQLSFSIPLDKIENYFDFVHYENKSDAYKDVENVKKLFTRRCQIELIPFKSDSFNMKHFPTDVLNGYFYKLLDNLFAVERKVVIFTGSAFKDLFNRLKLKELKICDTQKFYLNEVNFKNKFAYTPIYITYNDKTIKAIIADTFPMMGFIGEAMEKYAAYIIENEYLKI